MTARVPRAPVAVVTGANRGLGLETARALAERGFTVVMAGRDRSSLFGARDELAEHGHRVIARELGPRVRVNAVCPGWVRTRTGGSGAERSVSEGARGIVWAATLGAGAPTGGFFRDGEPIPW